jgi:hypothetical protein
MSLASGCDASAGVPVETIYRFRGGIARDTLELERHFAFGGVAFAPAFRPYVPRFALSDFSQVIHPDAAHANLRTENVAACSGCTSTDWDGSWFAFLAPSGPRAGQGMIVLRRPSTFAVNLWLDDDAASGTNASSVLALPPSGGFTGDVREHQVWCFFDANTWPASAQSALALPPGCALDLDCNGSPSSIR